MDERKPIERVAYNIAEAAEALGVSDPMMYTYINRADFPAYRLGKRVLIDVAGLREWSARMAQERVGY